MKTEIFICQCHHFDHMLIVWKDEEDLVFEVHLQPLSFWRRLKHAVLYIFGRRSITGDFSEFLLKEEDYKRLKEIL